MDYDQAQEYLSRSLTFGIKLGLHRMKRLMELLHHPEQGPAYIHIAGTNGKGSVTTYCAAILASTGRRVGVYTSPYLLRQTERIRVIEGVKGLAGLAVDEETGEITRDEFAAAFSKVKEAVDVMLAEGYEQPTEFELITAVGFLHFTARACDVVVLETGLGGRLDSTNVVEHPLACVITALGYDHMERLGGTLRAIAAEKAGIIKNGCPVFLYRPQDLELPDGDAAEAETVIRNTCLERNAPLQIVGRGDIVYGDYGWNGQSFTDQVSQLTLHTRLLGVVQPMNATLAVRVCRTLGLADDDQIRAGIAAARWPARLELLRREPPVLLDGAHNPQCCQALAASLNRLLPGRPVVFLAGVLQDKDYREMLNILLKNASYKPAAFICVTPDSNRALPAGQLADEIRRLAGQLPSAPCTGYNGLNQILAAETPAAGARMALEIADRQHIALCAFGSLYMVGSIRSILAGREA
ncbi:MAG: folylpolyglutamate synthase/dihydrofolate synthase family protein [Clostridiaceae bacterium]|nr:folylpolyglutamate synthase/dihydrofolate synthase family protein [Clostridiaceae bacterium]